MKSRKVCPLYSDGHPISSRRDDDQGATAVEYAILIALVGIVIVVAVGLLGRNLSGSFASAANALQPGVGAAAAPQTCPPTGAADPGEEDEMDPTCKTSTLEWECTPGYELKHEDNRYFCKRD